MALDIKYWPGYEQEGVTPTFYLAPGLFDNTKQNVAEALAWAETNWPDKSVPQTIILGTWLRDDDGISREYDYVMAGGQGEPSIESVAWNFRNGLKGFKYYESTYRLFLQAFKDAGYKIDHIAADIESVDLSSASTFLTGTGSEFTVLDVVQAMDADDSLGELLDLDVDAFALGRYGSRLGEQAGLVWAGWLRKQIATIWKEIFSDPAKAIFGNDCIFSNYDWSTHSNLGVSMIHWGAVGSPDNRIVRINQTPAGVSAPVLYINRTYFDSADEAINALHSVDKPCIPWVGGPWRTDDPSGPEDWSLNTPTEFAKLMTAIGDYGCTKVMVF